MGRTHKAYKEGSLVRTVPENAPQGANTPLGSPARLRWEDGVK